MLILVTGWPHHFSGVGRPEIDPLLWRPRTWGLLVWLFKNNGAEIAERGMEAKPVREALHIRKDGLSSLCTRLEACEINACALERSEERLAHGVIPTGAFAAHTDRDTHFCQERLIGMARVVTSAVGVMDSSSLRRALGQSHAQCVFEQCLVSRGGHGPSSHAA